MLEHRWFISERAGGDVGMKETIESYVRDVLESAPAEQITFTRDDLPITQELPAVAFENDDD